MDRTRGEDKSQQSLRRDWCRDPNAVLLCEKYSWLVPRRIADQRHGIRSVRPLMAGSEAIVRWSLTRNSLFNDERGLCSSGLLDQSNRSQIVRAGIRWRVNEVWYSECCACGHGEDRCGRCTEYQDDTQRTIPGRADVWISEHASEQEQAVNAFCSRQ